MKKVYPKRLLISFSGGKTSAYMLWWLMNKWEDRDQWEIVVVFANTGKEVEGTLLFVDDCANEWNVPIVWVEAVPKVKGKGWGVTHSVVTYETASRKGEPFEAMIARIGIPTTNAPFCSDQLKRKAIESYMKSIGWKGYWKALGMRIDEPKRIRKNAVQRKIMYPLWDLDPQTKQSISDWWSAQSFGLGIHPDDGNCDNCWKKDILRLVRNANRKPSSFDWWQEMTDKYGDFNPRNSELKPPFNFYRGNLSPKDIFYLATLPLEEINKMATREKLDGCQESCEAF